MTDSYLIWSLLIVLALLMGPGKFTIQLLLIITIRLLCNHKIQKDAFDYTSVNALRVLSQAAQSPLTSSYMNIVN